MLHLSVLLIAILLLIAVEINMTVLLISLERSAIPSDHTHHNPLRLFLLNCSLRPVPFGSWSVCTRCPRAAGARNVRYLEG